MSGALLIRTFAFALLKPTPFFKKIQKDSKEIPHRIHQNELDYGDIYRVEGFFCLLIALLQGKR
jgi:hypothetical protein